MTAIVYLCPICHRDIVTEARGGPHPSPGDHDPAYHVAKAYGTTHPTVAAVRLPRQVDRRSGPGSDQTALLSTTSPNRRESIA